MNRMDNGEQYAHHFFNTNHSYYTYPVYFR